jgi:hypothetical protein
MKANKQKIATRIWLALVILWAIGRALFVNHLFSSYGINGALYFVVDLASSIPYAIFSARLVITFIGHDLKGVYRNILLTTFFFYIPDFYILIAARKVPSSLYVILFFTIFLFSAFAIGAIARDIRHKRRSRENTPDNSL